MRWEAKASLRGREADGVFVALDLVLLCLVILASSIRRHAQRIPSETKQESIARFVPDTLGRGWRIRSRMSDRADRRVLARAQRIQAGQHHLCAPVGRGRGAGAGPQAGAVRQPGGGVPSAVQPHPAHQQGARQEIFREKSQSRLARLCRILPNCRLTHQPRPSSSVRAGRLENRHQQQ